MGDEFIGGQEPWHLPDASQVAAALAAAALVSPAALGGIPVLPVTVEDERRRNVPEQMQQSESDVGTHQDVEAAATALALSQRRLAAVTREVEGTYAHDIYESDVVRAAGKVARGEVPLYKQRAFRSALGRVAVDSVDLFILLDDERAEQEEQDDSREDWDDWEDPDDWD